jgi:hypothetical protein
MTHDIAIRIYQVGFATLTTNRYLCGDPVSLAATTCASCQYLQTHKRRKVQTQANTLCLSTPHIEPLPHALAVSKGKHGAVRPAAAEEVGHVAATREHKDGRGLQSIGHERSARTDLQQQQAYRDCHMRK